MDEFTQPRAVARCPGRPQIQGQLYCSNACLPQVLEASRNLCQVVWPNDHDNPEKLSTVNEPQQRRFHPVGSPLPKNVEPMPVMCSGIPIKAHCQFHVFGHEYLPGCLVGNCAIGSEAEADALAGFGGCGSGVTHPLGKASALQQRFSAEESEIEPAAS